MPLFHPLARVLGLLCFLFAANTGVAAPKPLPPLSPEELAVRALLQPLREHGAEIPEEELQSLRAWLDARHQAEAGRAAERELTRTLKRMHDDANRDLLRAAEWVHRLQVQRTKLYSGLTEEKADLERTLEEYQESPPVPDLEEVLPGHAGISDAFLLADDAAAITGDAGLPATSDDALSLADIGAPSLASAADADMDEARLLNRLTLDLTMLGHVLHACDNEYEAERARHRAALAALNAIITEARQERRASSVK